MSLITLLQDVLALPDPFFKEFFGCDAEEWLRVELRYGSMNLEGESPQDVLEDILKEGKAYVEEE